MQMPGRHTSRRGGQSKNPAIIHRNWIFYWARRTMYPEYLFDNSDLDKLGNGHYKTHKKAATLEIPKYVKSFHIFVILNGLFVDICHTTTAIINILE